MGLISRQVAIKSIENEQVIQFGNKDSFDDGWNAGIEACKEAVEKLPPAIEPLTDKEQRIFLAAMEREEKVCEEMDKQYVREAYEDSLVSICREIRRKVKGALWT